MADKVVSVKLQAAVEGFVSGMKKAKASVDDVTKAAAPSKAQAFENLSNKAALAGVGIATAVGVATKRFADFDAAMSAVQANSGATGQTLDSLREAAIKLGADSQFSATEAAQGINELAKAGIDAQDVLGGGLKGSLDLAAAGQISVADAAETAATAMTQFNLEGNQVPHVADLLANAANKAQGGVGDMAQALKQAGLVAASTGLSIEETTAGLTAFASAGLIGSDAGTAFKTMLQRLSAPSGEAQAQMDKLGISAYDAQGNFVGLANVAGQLQKGMENLTPEQRNAALAIIFGSDAVRAANVLYSEGADGINRWTNEVSEQGAAAKQAAILTDNLKGDIERLGGAVDSVFIQTGSGANGSLRSLTQGLTGFVNVVGDIPGPLLLAGAAVTSTALLAPKAALMWRNYTDQLDALTETAPRAGRAINALGRASAISAGVFAAAQAFDALGKEIAELRDIRPVGVETATAAIIGGGDAAKNFAANLDLARGNTARFDSIVNNLVLPTRLLGGELEATKVSIEAYDTALADLVRSGNAKVAADFLDRANVSAATAAQKLPVYTEALKGAANEAALGAPKQAQMAAAAGEVKTSAEEAKDALDGYIKGLQDAGLVVLSNRAAQRDLKAALSEVTGQLEKNGKTLNINTDKGRENADFLDGLAEKHLKAADAIYEETGSEEKYRASLVKSRASLVQTAIRFGMTKAEAEKYAASILRIPPAKNTKVTLTTVNEAALDRIGTKLANLKDKHVTLTVGTVKVGNTSINAGQFADGGYTGDGGKYEPAGIVHRGEYVFDKASTASIGKATLDYFRTHGNLPGYASGGYVTARQVPQRLMAPASSLTTSGGNTYAPTFQAYGLDADAAVQKAMRQFEYRVVSDL